MAPDSQVHPAAPPVTLWPNLARALNAVSLPSPRAESYKYTSLRALERAAAGQNVLSAWQNALPEQMSALAEFSAAWRPLELECADALTLAPDLSSVPLSRDLSSVPLSRDFDALNDEFAHSAARAKRYQATLRGLQLHVCDSAISQQYALSLRVPEATSACLLSWLDSDQRAGNSESRDQRAGNPESGFALINRLAQLRLEPGAKLIWIRVQAAHSKAQLLDAAEIVLESGAELTMLDVNLGAQLSRSYVRAQLVGKQARFELRSLQLGSERQHQDLQLEVRHMAPETQSEIALRALAHAKSRLVTRGGIYVHPGADQTDANLQSKSMLLSDAAEIDCKPELEIHADEVKAAHGASVGQLDAQALFYLQSRGIDAVSATRMLQRAFCDALLQPLKSADAAHQTALELVAEQLQSAVARHIDAWQRS